MYIKMFENGIFISLIITVGMAEEEFGDRFKNIEKGHEGEISRYFGYDASVVLVRDIKEEINAILLWFEGRDRMKIRIIAHECFHVDTSLMSYHNMSMGFNVGEDEHAACIAGWSANCCLKVMDELDDKHE